MVLDSRESRQIWNRAIRVSLMSPTERSDLGLRPGDEALAAVLELDSPAGNGGLLHGIEVVGDEKVRAAIDGLTYLGLDDAAFVVADITARLQRLERINDEDAIEDLEVEAGHRYWRVANGEAITRAVDRRMESSPDDFAEVTRSWEL